MRPTLLVTKQWAWFPPSRQIQVQTGCGMVGARSREGTDWCLVETVSVSEDGAALEVGDGNSNRILAGFQATNLHLVVEVVNFMLHGLFHN